MDCRKIILALFFLFIITVVYSNDKYYLKIYTNKRVQDRKVQRLLKNKKVGDSISLSHAINKLMLDIQKEGYLAAGIDSIKYNEHNVHVYLHLGEKYRWCKLKRGNVPEKILSRADINLNKFAGKPIKPYSVYRIQRKLVQWYENNGYPFARIKLDSIRFIKEGVKANLNISTYDFFTFDSIIMKGKPRLSNHYLRNYLDVGKGEPYDHATFQKIDERLNELDFIELIRPSRNYFKDQEVDVYTYFKNRKSNQFDGIVGFLPDDEEDGKVMFTGEINLKLKNSFARGELIKLSWQRFESLSQKLDIDFMYPYLFNSRFGLDFSYSLRKQDTSYLITNPVVGVRFFSGGGDYLRLFMDYKSSSLITSSVNDLMVPFAEYKRLLYGLGLHYSQLDYVYNPRDGWAFNADVGYGNKKTTLEGKVYKSNQAEINTYSVIYIPLFSKTAIKLSNRTGIIESFNITQDSIIDEQVYLENELYRIGGVNTLRGFDDESVYASNYSIFSVEYRYLFEKNSAVYLFFDGAYYDKHTRDEFISDYPLGFGVGVNFETGAGIFTLNYALGKQFDNPIEISSAKIHIGFVNRF